MKALRILILSTVIAFVTITTAQELIPDSFDDSKEQLIAKYNPSFDWCNQTPNKEIAKKAILNAIMSYIQNQDPAIKIEILQMIIIYLQIPETVNQGFEFGIKYKVYVVDVIDGDTIDVKLPNGTVERVRMLGVDTPETAASENEPYEYDAITNLNCLAYWGLQAKQFTESNLLNRYVYIEFDELAGFRGYYGRLLAYVYLENGTDFTSELVKRGYARVYEEGTFAKESEYLVYQNLASLNASGLWSCKFNYTTTMADVRIYYVHYDAYGNDHYNLNDEYVVLKSYGDSAVNLLGWTLEDEAGHYYNFPHFVLEPGAIVRIHSGCGVDTSTDLYWCSDWAIWNNDGDTAYLYDSSGNLVDSYSW